jgi:hypothetical protein
VVVKGGGVVVVDNRWVAVCSVRVSGDTTINSMEASGRNVSCLAMDANPLVVSGASAHASSS